VENPFERYDLDPREGIAAITHRLKELAEDANDEAERQRIREAWEELTLHPARRLRAALFAHPETRAARGSPPPRSRPKSATPIELDLREIAPRPSLLATVARGTDELDAAPQLPASLDDDPVLRRP
jgi:hypothetical protein